MYMNVVKLGRMRYQEALKIQEKLLDMRLNNYCEDTLLLVEHPHVITLGKRGKVENILLPVDELKRTGTEICEVNRGGDVTYHGPGQIVGYPIMDLKNHGRDVRRFIHNIEEIFIMLLDKEYGITAGRISEHTGVWVGQEKITAIGFAIKHWVTMHGFAFNVNTDLDCFKWIVPCGITDKGVTSIQKLLNKQQDYENAVNLVIRYFSKVFGISPVLNEIKTILGKEGN